MRLLTFTTLFPNNEQPNHGIFVQNRLRHFTTTYDVESVVLAPVPFFPARSPWLGRWSRYARVLSREERHGLTIYHPRFLAIPKVGMSAAPFLLYAASARAVSQLIEQGIR